MSDIVRFFPTFLVLMAVVWFVSFQMNPYNVCEDHEIKSDYYVCQPLGFELKKGWLERDPDHKILNESRSGYMPKSKKTAKKQKLQDMCSNKSYRETEEGLINCGE